METKHVVYSYKKYTIILLVAFLLALITPKLVHHFRYTDFRIVWQVGITASMILNGLSIAFSFTNSLFIFLEFRETKKWNFLWLMLSLIPFLYWSCWLIIITFLLPNQ